MGSETKAERAARQLKALMERHHVRNSSEFEKMMADAGAEPLISQVTIRRILNAQAREAPERGTLERLSAFFGEPRFFAFPDIEEENAVIVDVGDRKFALLPIDGRPVSPALARAISDALSEMRPLYAPLTPLGGPGIPLELTPGTPEFHANAEARRKRKLREMAEKSGPAASHQPARKHPQRR